MLLSAPYWKKMQPLEVRYICACVYSERVCIARNKNKKHTYLKITLIPVEDVKQFFPRT